MSEDRLDVLPWNGRSASGVVGLQRLKDEKTTPRIPEEILAPLLRAAVFYVETASGDILAARKEIAALEAAHSGRRLGPGQAQERVLSFIADRRAAGRGIPAVPGETAHTVPDAVVVDGVLQEPNSSLFSLLAGCKKAAHLRALMVEAGKEIGYEEGGLEGRQGDPRLPCCPAPRDGRAQAGDGAPEAIRSAAPSGEGSRDPGATSHCRGVREPDPGPRSEERRTGGGRPPTTGSGHRGQERVVRQLKGARTTAKAASEQT